MKISASTHGIRRAKERAGWGRAALLRMLERIYYLGLSINDCFGTVEKYLRSIQVGDGRHHLRIYGEHVFIFSSDYPDEAMLVTLYKIPRELRVRCKALRSERSYCTQSS